MFAAAFTLGHAATAHEVRPAYLALTEIDSSAYRVVWKQPLLGDRRLPLEPVLPAGCQTTARDADSVTAGALVQRWQVECEGDLRGARLAVDGLAATLTDVLLRVEWADGTVTTTLLRPERPFSDLADVNRTSFWVYLWLGIEHLLLGVDHVLFVVTLMFFVRRIGLLIRTVTAFTVAHSLTLALSALDLVRLPQPPVEAVIALSIAFLAVEKLRGADASLTARYTWVVALAFGLLHGFGFAGALHDIGLPRDSALWALFLFNVGVEIGQLVIIALVLALLRAYAWVVPRAAPTSHEWAASATLYGIGGVSAYWFLDRTAAILVG